MRQMRRIRVLALLLCTVLLSACGDRSAWKLGTASEGGNYYLLGQAMEEHLPTKIIAKETAGSDANLRLLNEGYLQLVIAQNDRIDADEKQDYSAVAGLYDEPVQVIVRADSGIQDMGDLFQKTVSIGEKESGIESNAWQILEAYGLSDRMVMVQNHTYREAEKALEDGSIDAMFVTAGFPTKVVRDAAERTPLRLLKIDGNAAKTLQETYDFYHTVEIPAGTYPGQDHAVPTIAVRSVLLAKNDLPEKQVKELTRQFFEHSEELNRAVPVEMHLNEANAARNVAIPFHPGAAAYYEEQGIHVRTK